MRIVCTSLGRFLMVLAIGCSPARATPPPASAAQATSTAPTGPAVATVTRITTTTDPIRPALAALNAIPEPASAALLAIGFAALALIVRLRSGQVARRSPDEGSSGRSPDEPTA